MQETFSPEQSIRLIHSMIDKTKANISVNRFYFLLWGWIAFIGILSQFVLKVVLLYEHHYLVWLITFAGLFATVYHSWKRRGIGHVRTYIGESMSYLWTGMGISFFVLCFIMTNVGWQHAWPFFILFYGLGTFVSGKILRFTPLVVGGIINWVLACAATFFPFDYQLLFAAAAILSSYLIPGYMIQTENKNSYA